MEDKKVREKIAAWLEKNSGKEAAKAFKDWATDEKWEAVVKHGMSRRPKIKEYTKDHEIKSMEDVYTYLRETYGDEPADFLKKHMEQGTLKEIAKNATKKHAGKYM